MELPLSVSTFLSQFPEFGGEIFFLGFLILNGLIVLSDIKNKIIPNKLLILLILIFFINVGMGYDSQMPFRIDWWIGVFVVFFVGFGIYLLHGWAPGDAKYFFVLSLFLGTSFDMVRFMGNISTLSVIGILGTSFIKLVINNSWRDIYTHRHRPKKEKKGKSFDSFIDIMVYLVTLIGFYLLFIFFREFLYGNNQKLHSFGIDTPILLFIGLILIRYIQGEIRNHKDATKIKLILVVISSIPILYGFLMKGFGLWYYMRDIFLYAVPTLLLIALLVHYASRIFNKQEKNIKKYSEILPSEIPRYIMKEDGTHEEIKNPRDFLMTYLEGTGDTREIRVMVEKSSPFGHYLFASFLVTALTPLHFAHIILSEWYYLLKEIWNFLYQFL